MLGSMFSFVQGMDNYDDRKVARIDKEDNNGIGVSTAYTSDEGYETALLDDNGAHPVERYVSKEDSLKGHEKWVKFAHSGNGKKVVKLGGLCELVDDEEITLKACD